MDSAVNFLFCDEQELTNSFSTFTFAGYNYIFTIPVNSTDIVITQYGWKNREDSNYLG